MKKLFILFFIVLHLILSPSITTANDFSFKATQSYELKDLILYFTKDTKNISWIVASKTDNNILWKRVEPNKNSDLYQMRLDGTAGVLINGVGRTKLFQNITPDGELVKTTSNYGINADLTIFACPYWNPRMLSINLVSNLPNLSKMFNNKDLKNMFWGYLETQGFTIIKLWEKGDISFGETAAIVKHPKTNDVYMICRTNSGASGLISNANIRIFKTLDDTKADTIFYMKK